MDTLYYGTAKDFAVGEEITDTAVFAMLEIAKANANRRCAEEGALFGNVYSVSQSSEEPLKYVVVEHVGWSI
jgi:hypothetical protein